MSKENNDGGECPLRRLEKKIIQGQDKYAEALQRRDYLKGTIAPLEKSVKALEGVSCEHIFFSFAEDFLEYVESQNEIIEPIPYYYRCSYSDSEIIDLLDKTGLFLQDFYSLLERYFQYKHFDFFTTSIKEFLPDSRIAFLIRKYLVGLFKIGYNIRTFEENHTKHEIKNCTELAQIYSAQTPLAEFFFTSLPYSIPFMKRFEHAHICAGSGHGKTQLLQGLIYQDILKCLDGKGGLCVIDSQGDIIELLSHLAEFDPQVKKSLAEKLILIDPTDIEYPPALNMFDTNLERLRGKIKPTDFERLQNSNIEMFKYIFEGLGTGLGGAGYQDNIFVNCAKLLFKIEGANILTFLDLLQDGEKFRKHFDKLDPISKAFFENKYFQKTYAGTREQIAVRMQNLLNNPTFARMLSTKKNKIDLFDAMNSGKVVLINTAKEYLQEEQCKMMGKIFIAMILQATNQRATIPEDKRKAFFVYIDEAQDYLSDSIATFLSQARKYKVGMIFAHQYLKQLSEVSQNLVASVESNTSIKIMGKVSLTDAKKMADLMGRKPEDFRALKKKDRKYTEWICSVRDITEPAIKVKIPLGMVNQKKQMSEASFQILKDQQRAKFCESSKGISKPKLAPATDQTEETKTFFPSFPKL